MAREVFRIDGLQELEQALVGLANEFGVSRTTGKNILRRALMRAGKPIEVAAERLAPEFKGQLKRSIDTSATLSKRQRGQHRKKSAVEVFVGAGPLPQAHLQEFGTAHQPSQPFLRPAWDANRMASLEIVKGALAEEIEKARQRLVKKRAKSR
jgi:HK97 gp10 family phage protein